MAESARPEKAPLIPERATSYIHPAVNDDLLIRIRSLLDARKSQLSQRAPHPSNQHSVVARNTGLDHPTVSSTRKQPRPFKPGDATAKLPQLKSELATVSGIAIDRFDGPSSQIEDDDIDGTRRRPGQPSLNSAPKDRGNERISQPSTGLNLQTSVSGHATDQGNSSIDRSTSYKRKHNTTKPPHTISAMPPTYPWLKERRLRPQAQHVPGSFGSTVDPQAEQSSPLSSPTLSKISAASPLNTEATQSREPHFVGSKTAVASLLDAKDSDTVPVRSKASVREKRSQASLKSGASARTLLKPHADHSYLSQEVAQPVVTYGTEGVHSDLEVSDNIPLSPDASVQFQAQPHNQRGLKVEKGPKHPRALGSINGTPISQLLAELPPIKQTTINELNAIPITSEVTNTIQGLNPQHQSIREHSRELSFHDEITGHEFSDRTDLPPKNTLPADRVPQRRKNSQTPTTQSRSSPSTPLSNASRKAASLSRVITALSQFSSRSNLQALPLRSTTNYDRLGSTDDTRPAGTTVSEANSGPRNSWVQNLIGRSSTGDALNLTTRPSHTRRIPTQRDRAVTAIGNRLSQDENVHHDRSVTGATDEQAFVGRQQQNAETFSRVISDLETLLREALVIAHQAADKDEDSQALIHRPPSIRYTK